MGLLGKYFHSGSNTLGPAAQKKKRAAENGRTVSFLTSIHKNFFQVEMLP